MTPRESVPAASPSSEDLDGAFQRLPHAPEERNADKGPEQRSPGVQATKADAVRTRRTGAPGADRCRLQLGYFGVAHVPLLVDRLDQIVADQARDQHRAQDIHRCVVKLVTRHAGGKLELADVIHDYGT